MQLPGFDRTQVDGGVPSIEVRPGDGDVGEKSDPAQNVVHCQRFPFDGHAARWPRAPGERVRWAVWRLFRQRGSCRDLEEKSATPLTVADLVRKFKLDVISKLRSPDSIFSITDTGSHRPGMVLST